jgi:hypothetical protein
MSYRFNKRVLGIALGERSLQVAQGEGARAAGIPGLQAEFDYPSGVTLENAGALGAALAAFLREKGFTAQRVVFGVPARWLMLRNHTLPPVDGHNAQAILNLHAQAAAAPELGEMVFDYAGKYSDLQPADLTLVGMPALWRQRLLNFADAAGLNVVAITPSMLAINAAASAQNSLLLSIGNGGAELAAFEGGRITFLRHLGTGASIAAIAAELRRNVAMLKLGDHPSSDSATSPGMELILRDEVGVNEADIQTLSEAAQLRVVVRKTDLHDSAAALTALASGTAEIDFLHPKLVALTRPLITRRVLWIAATAAIITLLASLAFIDLFDKQRDITRSEQQLAAMEPALKIARPFVANMQIAEGYQTGKAKTLACLGDITHMLPEGGPTYLTSFHLQGNMRGDLAGRSASDNEVRNLLEKFAASGRFGDLKCKLEGRGSGAEVAFSVTFTYFPRP